MAPADFARRIGYHYSTLNQFLLDKYHRGPGSREAAICEAVLRFLGAQSEMEPETFAGTLYNIGNMRAMRKACASSASGPASCSATRPQAAVKPTWRARLFPVPHRPKWRSAAFTAARPSRAAISCAASPLPAGRSADIGIERTIANLRYDYAGRRVVLYSR